MHRSPDLDGIVGDRYLILDSLGQGAMADVHLAKDQRDRRIVAVKWLVRSRRQDAVFRDNLLQEAAPPSHVTHPNVVQLLDYGVASNGQPYPVLAALTGETLHEYIARNGATDALDA